MCKIFLFIKCFLGFGNIENGSICKASKLTTLDFHDYPTSKGGDGIPRHFYTYTCPKCNKNFEI